MDTLTPMRLLGSTTNAAVAHDLCVKLLSEAPAASRPACLSSLVEPAGLAALVQKAKADDACALVTLARDPETQRTIALRERRKSVLASLSWCLHLADPAARVLSDRLDYWATSISTSREELEDRLAARFDTHNFVEYALTTASRAPLSEAFIRKLIDIGPEARLVLSDRGFRFSARVPDLTLPGDLHNMRELCSDHELVVFGTRMLMVGQVGDEDLDTLQGALAALRPSPRANALSEVPTGPARPRTRHPWEVIQRILRNEQHEWPELIQRLVLVPCAVTNEQLAELIELRPELVGHVRVRLQELSDDVLAKYVDALLEDWLPWRNPLLSPPTQYHPEAPLNHGEAVYFADADSRERILRVCGRDVYIDLFKEAIRARPNTLVAQSLLDTIWSELSDDERRTLCTYVSTHHPQKVDALLEHIEGLGELIFDLLPSGTLRTGPCASRLLVAKLEERVPEHLHEDAMRLLLEHLPGYEGSGPELLDLIDAVLA